MFLLDGQLIRANMAYIYLLTEQNVSAYIYTSSRPLFSTSFYLHSMDPGG